MIDCVWLASGKWDQASLVAMMDGTWCDIPKKYEFTHNKQFDSIVADGILLIIPGGEYVGRENSINTAINKYKWVLVIVTSDERSLFNIDKLKHPNMKIWHQTPEVGKYKNANTVFGVLLPPAAIAKFDGRMPYDKAYEWVMIGQAGHIRRDECFDVLEGFTEYNNVILLETGGFTQGMSPDRYYNVLSMAKVAPCPSGVYTPDTFRLYEALEAGCIPIADDISPAYNSRGYWDLVMSQVKMPQIFYMPSLPSLIMDILVDDVSYRSMQKKIYNQWVAYKKQLNYTLYSDIEELSGIRS